MQWAALAVQTISYSVLCTAEIDENADLRDKLREYEDLPDDVVFQFGLQHFSYNNSGVVDLIYDQLNRTNFTGISVSL